MTSQHKTLPINILPATVSGDEMLTPLLDEAFAQQLQTEQQTSPALLAKILGRAQRAIEQASDKKLTRASRVATTIISDGVSAKTLYVCDRAEPRLGEPLRVCLLEFAPASCLNMTQAVALGALTNGAVDREWLVVTGDFTLHGETLTERDYKIMPRDFASADCESRSGARVLVRESKPAISLSAQPASTLDSSDDWPVYAPGIRRRILWQRDGQAAMLYLTEPMAEVAHHSHHYDEECFMVQGELYLDDILLMEGDYQLAPHGTEHHVTRTDTGVVLFAHGDFDLRFIP
jgi:quercetin dioxygenase-like cupin family protein